MCKSIKGPIKYILKSTYPTFVQIIQLNFYFSLLNSIVKHTVRKWKIRVIL